MLTRKPLSIAILIPFVLLTAYALHAVGLVGFFAYLGKSPAGWQVFADLVVALLLLLTFLVPDARRTGRQPWIWVGLTLTLGSIGPLLYLATARDSNAV